MRILVCTEWCPRYQEVADVSLPNMYEYCARHDYGYHEIKLSNEEGFHYKKHEFFQEIFKERIYDLIFYKDIDSIITDLTRPIESFIDDEHDLFICKDDIFGINGGSLIIKNTPEGRVLNEEILSQADYFNNEQEVMNVLIGYKQWNQFVKILPHPSINSYPYNEYPELKMVSEQEGNWCEGNFLCHVPALPYERRAEVLRNLKIVR